jgi:hypothetical protein
MSDKRYLHGQYEQKTYERIGATFGAMRKHFPAVELRMSGDCVYFGSPAIQSVAVQVDVFNSCSDSGDFDLLAEDLLGQMIPRRTAEGWSGIATSDHNPDQWDV